MKKKIIMALMASLPMLAYAGGFQVNLQGNQQTGMGHLGTSFYLGASSAYFNPGMMGLGADSLGSWNFEGGVSLLFSDVAYQNINTGEISRTDNPMGTPFYFYGTYKINEKATAGLAVYTPFGSSVEWGDLWDGRYLIQDISLQAIFIQPTFSYQISENIGLGAGLVYATGNFEINRAFPYSNPNEMDEQINLSGGANGIGFNAGIHIQATEDLSFGLSYRSEVEMELEDGDVEISAPKSLSSNIPFENKFNATLPLPSTITLGAAYKVTDQFLVSAEVSRIGWSSYDTLSFDFKTQTEGFRDSHNPRMYEDSYIYRLGFQYTVDSTLALRVGAYYDQSPVQDDYFNPETPNTNNIGVTAGASYAFTEHISVDLSFLYITGRERTSYYTSDLNKEMADAGENFGGKYRSNAVIPGIGLHVTF